jgi:hypothetical protein
MAHGPKVEYRTDPSRYRHWKLTFDGPVATLAMDVAEDGGVREGYKLKLNSYDLGVDIELHDAVQRIRFEHPEVRSVIVTSAKDRVFCSGANIFMLGLSSHAWKVNFCKFTNETRNGLEDASRPFRDQVRRRRERIVCGRRLRARPRLRRDLARRRPLVHRRAALRCRCSACCQVQADSRASPTSAACGTTSPTSSAR